MPLCACVFQLPLGFPVFSFPIAFCSILFLSSLTWLQPTAREEGGLVGAMQLLKGGIPGGGGGRPFFLFPE